MEIHSSCADESCVIVGEEEVVDQEIVHDGSITEEMVGAEEHDEDEAIGASEGETGDKGGNKRKAYRLMTQYIDVKGVPSPSRLMREAGISSPEGASQRAADVEKKQTEKQGENQTKGGKKGKGPDKDDSEEVGKEGGIKKVSSLQDINAVIEDIKDPKAKVKAYKIGTSSERTRFLELPYRCI